MIKYINELTFIHPYKVALSFVSFLSNQNIFMPNFIKIDEEAKPWKRDIQRDRVPLKFILLVLIIYLIALNMVYKDVTFDNF